MNTEFVDVQSPPYCALLEDEACNILQFVATALAAGQRCALVTLVEIGGSAARSLGAQMAVTQHGAYCGYVSGGCVEAVVAQEAMLAIAANRDRQVRLGKGSAYFDIVLPCGSSLLLSIHVIKQPEPIQQVLADIDRRCSVALAYDPAASRLTAIAIASDAPLCSGWVNDVFVTVYRPALRLLLCGTGLEATRLGQVACALGIETVNGLDQQPVDRFSAIVLLYHDLDRETRLLGDALRSEAFNSAASACAIKALPRRRLRRSARRSDCLDPHAMRARWRSRSWPKFCRCETPRCSDDSHRDRSGQCCCCDGVGRGPQRALQRR